VLLRRADEAMYTAKTAGGGTHLHDLVGRPGQGRQTRWRCWPSFARRSNEARSPCTYNPRLGSAPRLQLAERHALTHDLIETVLHPAVETASRWNAAGPDLTVSVNLSARSLTDPHLLPVVEQVLRRHRLPPSHLTLEITEDCVIDEPDHAINLLDALRATGVRLSVDDFGTGYCSLSYLRRLPVDDVKIDRSFISTLADGPDSQVIVRAITDLGPTSACTWSPKGARAGTDHRRRRCGDLRSCRSAGRLRM
jgi:predicted signal transduction protein with EAL and GGDEF domain